MDKRKKELVALKLERVREHLKDAKDFLAQKRYRPAVNRAYYAVFHMTTALLLTRDVHRGKHSGVIAAFRELYIKTKVLEPDYGRILGLARELREEADYADEMKNLTPASAAALVADAERFVERIETYLRDSGALD